MLRETKPLFRSWWKRVLGGCCGGSTSRVVVTLNRHSPNPKRVRQVPAELSMYILF